MTVGNIGFVIGYEEQQRELKWHKRYLKLCDVVATWSKDPSTKVGAAIVRPDNTICSVGYNGFPRNIEDSDERLQDRTQKYELTVHGEINALLHAGESIKGYTLYTVPALPCTRCAVQLIQAGIAQVVAPKPRGDYLERWKDSHERSISLFKEAGVKVTEIVE